jgi:hypothetical protein
MNKIIFSNDETDTIINLYTKEKLSTRDIGVIFNISNIPIKRILKDLGLLRKANSNGIKILLTTEQESKIKELYLNENYNTIQIAKKIGLTPYFIDKYLGSVDYRRSKGEANSLYRTGRKLSEKTRKNMKSAQQKLARSGNRKQTGGICKNFNVNGLVCQGTYEKFYIEKLINDGTELPINPTSINTPLGVYYPDFEYDNNYIEIKSDYTYDILLGFKVNRYTKKIDLLQYEKIKWVNEHVKPIEILVVDKRNNKIIKKQI